VANQQIFGHVHDWTRAAGVENSRALVACILPAPNVPGVRKEKVGFPWQIFGNLEDWMFWSKEKSLAFARKRDMLQVYGLKIRS